MDILDAIKMNYRSGMISEGNAKVIELVDYILNSDEVNIEHKNSIKDSLLVLEEAMMNEDIVLIIDIVMFIIAPAVGIQV